MADSYEKERMLSTHRSKRGIALGLIAAGLIAFAAIGVWMSPGGDKGRDLGTGLRGVEAGARGEIGTTGPRGDVPGTENAGPAATPLTDPFEAIAGKASVQDLIGRRVELQMHIGQHINDVAFWTRFGDERLLVVLGRDMRDTRRRQTGELAETGFAPDADGVVMLSGRIEKVPHAEAVHSWGLTNPDREELLERPVYLRIDRISPVSALSPQP